MSLHYTLAEREAQRGAVQAVQSKLMKSDEEERAVRSDMGASESDGAAERLAELVRRLSELPADRLAAVERELDSLEE